MDTQSKNQVARAVRNNNPGNINAGQPWQGLMPRSQMTPDQAAETRFAVFESAAWGFRALAMILQSYSRIFHGAGKVFNVDHVIARWAPPSENNTTAYQTHVCVLTGFSLEQALPCDHSTVRALAKAISTHEVGYWAFTDTDLDQGISLASL